MIFAGTVLRVERVRPTHRNEIESVRITFRVDQAVRGVRVGQTISIREWAGLWVARPRYQLGERLMLFLYPPSKLGLTSPVGGGLGRFAVDPRGWLQPSDWQRQAINTSGILGKQPPRRGGIAVREFTRSIRRFAEE